MRQLLRRFGTFASLALLMTGSPGVAQPTPTDAPSPADAAVRREVQLVIYGAFPEALLDDISRGLWRELRVETLPVVRRELPAAAYYPPRRRYRAERLLDALEALEAESPGAGRLGLTSVDISTTKGAHRDWGIFGLGSLGGDSAVVSTHRLRRGARDDAHLRLRVVSVAVHEVGHMLGLPHCEEPACVMNDAHGSIRSVDEGPAGLGPACMEHLERVAAAGR